jgi:hypothetical protein
MTSFDNPRDYAHYIKRVKFQDIIRPDQEDMEHRKIFMADHYKFEMADNHNAEETRSQQVIDEIICKLKSVLSEKIQVLFEQHFYFSTIETRDINAAIYIHQPKKYFAVFINTALIDLISKLGKLNVIQKTPQALKFCNRFPGRKPSMKEITEMRNEYIAAFSTTKMAMGPFMVLHEKYATAILRL